MEGRRLLQNYEVSDLFSVSVLLLPLRLNQTPFYTSSSLSVSLCWFIQPTVHHSSLPPRPNSARAPCLSNFLIHIPGGSWTTDSLKLKCQPPVNDDGQPVSFSLPYSICIELLPSSVQAGMLIWEQGSFSQIAPGIGGPEWKHPEVQSAIGAKDRCYWLHGKSWWGAYCQLRNFLWSWVIGTILWLVSRHVSLTMMMMW